MCEEKEEKNGKFVLSLRTRIESSSFTVNNVENVAVHNI